MSHIPRVGSLMTRCLSSIEGDAGIHEAQVLMEKQEVRQLPVTENGSLVGLLTEREIELSLDPILSLPPMRKVRDIMIDDPYVVDVSESLDVVLSILTEKRVNAVLVAEHGELAGIFTTTDATRLLREHYRNQADS